VGKGHVGGRSVRSSYPYWPLWLAYFALGLNAWTASMAFHARDVRRTEARALLFHSQDAWKTLLWCSRLDSSSSLLIL